MGRSRMAASSAMMRIRAPLQTKMCEKAVSRSFLRRFPRGSIASAAMDRARRM